MGKSDRITEDLGRGEYACPNSAGKARTEQRGATRYLLDLDLNGCPERTMKSLPGDQSRQVVQ